MEIILLILFLIAIYLLAIVCVMFATNCSTKEAKALVINFIKDSISSESQTPICYYPTFIGIDDMGYPHSDIIENEFKDISDIFEQFYFYKCGRLDNRIWYSFKVSNPSFLGIIISKIIKCTFSSFNIFNVSNPS